MFCRNTLSLWSQSCLYLPADESYYIKKVNFWNAIPFSTSRCKIEGCEKRALSPRSLTESSAESELSRLDAHWDSLCGPVLITSSENYEKEGCETWSALPFWRSHCLDFLFLEVDLELLPFIAEHVMNIENKTNLTLLSVFPSVWRANTCHLVF